jgi:hypothetical protein
MILELVRHDAHKGVRLVDRRQDHGVDADRRGGADAEALKRPLVLGQVGLKAGKQRDEQLEPAHRAAQPVKLHRLFDQAPLLVHRPVGLEHHRRPAGQPRQEVLGRLVRVKVQVDGLQHVLDRAEQVLDDPQKVAHHVAAGGVAALVDRRQPLDVAVARHPQADVLGGVDHLAALRPLL